MITEGPWFVGKEQYDDYGCHSITIGPFEAECHYESTICEVWGDNHDGEANAKAISVVPELIDIAKRVLVLYEGTDAPIYKAAKAALEKANVK